jgi:hypothetical protein
MNPAAVRRPPGYWMHETSGVLKPVVQRYLEDRATMTLRDVAIMRAYLVQWFGSDVWEQNPHGAAGLPELRAEAERIRTAEDVEACIGRAVDMGMDPL